MSKRSKTSEKRIERSIVQFAEARGCLVYKFISPNKRAVPDRIFMYKGALLFIEVKAPGEQPSVLQSIVHDTIRSHKVPVYAIDSTLGGHQLISEFCAFIDKRPPKHFHWSGQHL